MEGLAIEKILVKTGIYSFTLSFMLLLVGMDRIKSTTDVNGMISSVETTYPDFFFMITRYSIIISIITVILVYAFLLLKKKK
jgi:hypothetical protein